MEYEEYLHDLDERYIDDQYICDKCGKKLKRDYEDYEFWGFRGRREIWYCPSCE